MSGVDPALESLVRAELRRRGRPPAARCTRPNWPRALAQSISRGERGLVAGAVCEETTGADAHARRLPSLARAAASPGQIAPTVAHAALRDLASVADAARAGRGPRTHAAISAGAR